FALDGFYFHHYARKSLHALMGTRAGPHHEFVTPGEVKHLMHELGVDAYEIFGRMFAPLRIIYKLHPRLGAWMARRLSQIDDSFSTRRWNIPFAGHLVLVAQRPRLTSQI